MIDRGEEQSSSCQRSDCGTCFTIKGEQKGIWGMKSCLCSLIVMMVDISPQYYLYFFQFPANIYLDSANFEKYYLWCCPTEKFVFLLLDRLACEKKPNSISPRAKKYYAIKTENQGMHRHYLWTFLADYSFNHFLNPRY